MLRAVELEIVDREACRNAYMPTNITSRMVCAGVPEGGKGSCYGDSGGALVPTKSGKEVGIVSWAWGCAQKKFPTVFANVADGEMYDFIERELKPVALISSLNRSDV